MVEPNDKIPGRIFAFKKGLWYNLLEKWCGVPLE